MAQAPADWYPDPLGRHEYRYWDGAAWTDHVADAGQASIDPLEAQRPAGTTETDVATATEDDRGATGAATGDDSGASGAVAVDDAAGSGTDDDVIDPYGVTVVHEEPRPVEQEGSAGQPTPVHEEVEARDTPAADPGGAMTGNGGTGAAGDEGETTPVPGPGIVGAPAYPATTAATGARDAAGSDRGTGATGGSGTEDSGTGDGTAGRTPIRGIRGSLIEGSYAESETEGPVMLQNERMLKVRLGDDVLARQGAMVAFQGSVQFDYEGSGSVSRMFKKAVTNEGLPLMRCHGEGDLFLAHNADEIHLLWLDGGGITVSGRNVLAFHHGLDWDIQRVSGVGVMSGGLFNTVLSGTGWVAITTHGTPVVLRTDAPTFADSDAVVAWSSNLSTSLNKTYSASSFIGRGSGEVAQLSFSGDGVVIVQASEGPAVAQHSH